jgi:hypothetical protein
MNAAAVFACGFASCGGCEVSCVLSAATLSAILLDVVIEEPAVSCSAKAFVLTDSRILGRHPVASTTTTTGATMANNPLSPKILCFVEISFIISPNTSKQHVMLEASFLF